MLSMETVKSFDDTVIGSAYALPEKREEVSRVTKRSKSFFINRDWVKVRDLENTPDILPSPNKAEMD